MKTRALLGLAVAGLLLGTALAVLTGSASGSAQQGRPSQADPGRRRPFVHRRHVPKVWARGTSAERLRDCRGCHVFDEDGGRDPQAVCTECHIAAEGNQSSFETSWEPGWETLAGYRDPDSAFRHHTHARLACRECHQPEQKTAVDPMPIRRGSSECTRCHGPDAEAVEFETVPPTAEPLVPDSARRKLLDELNRSESMLPDRLDPFYHSEHLTDPGASFDLAALLAPASGAPEASASARCTSCHEPVVRADVSSLHGDRFKAESCGECHIGRSGPLEFAASLEAGESAAALTFSHADHLNFDAANRDGALSNTLGYARIEQEGCHACHDYQPGVRNFVVTEAAAHEGCVSCHADEGWRAARHGEWEAWGCTGCHTFAEPGGLASDRPLVPVRRRRGQKFQIESQVHPHIAGDTDTELFRESCKECHRAPVEELPSRLGTRAFSHATHLPPDPTPEQCAVCHGSRVAAAASSAALSENLNGRPISSSDTELGVLLGLTYDLRACDECHRGGTPVPLEVDVEELEPVAVPAFAHADHIGARGPDGATIDCMSCHAPDDEAGGPVGTLPTALDCTRCHDHRPGPKSENSGLASAEEIARCARCHVGVTPAAATRLPVERARLTVLKGTEGQFHPEDRHCNECHQAEWTRFAEATLVEGDHVFGIGGRHLDGRVMIREQHQHRFLRQEQAVLCLMCHWAATISGHNFEDESNRVKYGNLLVQDDEAGTERPFPGGAYRAEHGGR